MNFRLQCVLIDLSLTDVLFSSFGEGFNFYAHSNRVAVSKGISWDSS